MKQRVINQIEFSDLFSNVSKCVSYVAAVTFTASKFITYVFWQTSSNYTRSIFTYLSLSEKAKWQALNKACIAITI